MRASITVSRISISLLMAAALSLCPAPSAAAPTMQWDGDQSVTGVLNVGASAPGTPSLTIAGAYPMQLTYSGTESLTKSVIYYSSAIGYLIDLARTGNSTSYPSYNFGVARRGESAPMFFVNGNSKNVGIGTNEPLARLHVSTLADGYAAMFTNGGGTAARKGIKILCGQGTPTTTNYFIECFDGSGGNRGGVVVTDSGVCHFAQSCDAIFKTDIADSPMQGLEIVKGIPVRSFRIGTGPLVDGFVAQEVEALYPQAVAEVVDDPTSTTRAGSHKVLLPLALIPPLFKAVQEQDARILELERQIAALASQPPTSSLQSTATGLAPQASALSLQSCLSDAEILRLTEAVLKKIGVDPWVEVSLAEAWEEVDETAPVSAPQTVTRYRVNMDTIQVETYTVQETVTQQQPTGRKVKQLKPDVRFDEKTGKFYRWCGLGGTAANGTTVNGTADAAQAAAALGKLSRQIACLGTQDSRLQSQDSPHSPQSSALSPQSWFFR